MKIQALFISLIITMSASSQVFIDSCMDLENVDFGFCDMAMGIGVVGGECVFISGCGWVVDGIDYTQLFTQILNLANFAFMGEEKRYLFC